MKQFKLLSILLVTIIFVSSCNKTPHDKIIGKWDVAKIENPQIEDSDIDAFNELNKETLENQIYTFSEQEKVSKKTPVETVGEWEMDEAGTVLTLDWGESDIMSPHSYTIKALTKESLIIEEDFEDFIITTSFVKIK